MSDYVFDLYIAGHTARSRRAVQNLTELCEDLLPGRHTLNIINVLEQPQAAEEGKVITTPTLIQRKPQPGRRIIGDLSDRRALLQALELEPDAAAARSRTRESRDGEEREGDEPRTPATD